MIKLWHRFELWIVSFGFALFVTVVNSLFRVRMSHNSGVVGMGRITIVDSPTFPAHDFFTPGRRFPCRLRHAGVSYPDDAALQVYGASLKFADSNWESPFDIEMNTGTISLFWNVKSFIQFGLMKDQNGWVTFRPYYKKYKQGLLAARDSVRWLPSSFALLRYYSQTPTLFNALDGTKYYVKYRLVPEDTSQPETGRVPPERLATVWDAQPPQTEQPNRDYLKEEYKARVQPGLIRYRLQLQLHPSSPTESQEIFNSNTIWDEAAHPWLELATLEIDRVGTWEDAVLTRTSLGNAPKSLKILCAHSLDDYNSLNYMRVHSSLARRVRIFMDKLLGVPPPPSPQRTLGGDPNKGG